MAQRKKKFLKNIENRDNFDECFFEKRTSKVKTANNSIIDKPSSSCNFHTKSIISTVKIRNDLFQESHNYKEFFKNLQVYVLMYQQLNARHILENILGKNYSTFSTYQDCTDIWTSTIVIKGPYFSSNLITAQGSTKERSVENVYDRAIDKFFRTSEVLIVNYRFFIHKIIDTKVLVDSVFVNLIYDFKTDKELKDIAFIINDINTDNYIMKKLEKLGDTSWYYITRIDTHFNKKLLVLSRNLSLEEILSHKFQTNVHSLKFQYFKPGILRLSNLNKLMTKFRVKNKLYVKDGVAYLHNEKNIKQLQRQDKKNDRKKSEVLNNSAENFAYSSCSSATLGYLKSLTGENIKLDTVASNEQVRYLMEEKNIESGQKEADSSSQQIFDTRDTVIKKLFSSCNAAEFLNNLKVYIFMYHQLDNQSIIENIFGKNYEIKAYNENNIWRSSFIIKSQYFSYILAYGSGCSRKFAITDAYRNSVDKLLADSFVLKINYKFLIHKIIDAERLTESEFDILFDDFNNDMKLKDIAFNIDSSEAEKVIMKTLENLLEKERYNISSIVSCFGQKLLVVSRKFSLEEILSYEFNTKFNSLKFQWFEPKTLKRCEFQNKMVELRTENNLHVDLYKEKDAAYFNNILENKFHEHFRKTSTLNVASSGKSKKEMNKSNWKVEKILQNTTVSLDISKSHKTKGAKQQVQESKTLSSNSYKTIDHSYFKTEASNSQPYHVVQNTIKNLFCSYDVPNFLSKLKVYIFMYINNLSSENMINNIIGENYKIKSDQIDGSWKSIFVIHTEKFSLSLADGVGQTEKQAKIEMYNNAVDKLFLNHHVLKINFKFLIHKIICVQGLKMKVSEGILKNSEICEIMKDIVSNFKKDSELNDIAFIVKSVEDEIFVKQHFMSKKKFFTFSNLSWGQNNQNLLIATHNLTLDQLLSRKFKTGIKFQWFKPGEVKRIDLKTSIEELTKLYSFKVENGVAYSHERIDYL